MRPYQFCNLCEVNVSNIESQDDLNNRVKAAAFLGTLQASYTEVDYLRPVRQRTTEKDALIGEVEADDIIAHLSNKITEKPNTHAYIVSADKDFLQLVNKQITVYRPLYLKMMN